MSTQHSQNDYPKLHNAMWPGLVGKGSPGAEPSIDLDTMLNLTAQAEVDGIRFDGVDLFLFEPHVNIDIDDDGIKRLAEKITSKGFVVGSVVAPVWPPTGGGSAMGSEEDRQKFVGQVRKACRIAQKLRELGARPEGVIRIDSASGVTDWTADPETNQKKIAETFNQACDVAEEFGERLAAEGEICWGGMQSWKKMVDLLERVNRPKVLGFQADMAHTLLYVLGYNAPEDAILPPEWDWSDPQKLDEALKTLTQKLRPWTIDFHVAQNDATVHGSGTHDKTGHHCLPKDPNGKLSIAQHARHWLRGDDGKLTKAIRHICWDGCMFPNETMMKPETWTDILAAMIAVRDAHGWRSVAIAEPESNPVEVVSQPTPARKSVARPKAKKASKPTMKKAPKKVAAKRTTKPAARKVAKKLKVKAKAPAKVKTKLSKKVGLKSKAKPAKPAKKSKTKSSKAPRKAPAAKKKARR